MIDEKSNPAEKLQALAAEACDLWQEHLAAYAADPKAKAELMRMLEPSRRLFAEWAQVMQHGLYGASNFGKNGSSRGAGGAAAGHHGGENLRQDAAHQARPTTAGAASGDGDDDVARLAARLAELESKLAGLEHGDAKKTGGAQKPPRPKSKS